MKIHALMADAFIKEGTTTLFGLMGDGQMEWWSKLHEHGVKTVDARDEGAALTMAEGWAMATGKVGVASSTRGPGLARMSTALIVASRSRTPIVVYTTKAPLNNDTVIQYLDQEPLVKATGAGYIEVQTPGFAEDAVRQAFYRARRESRPIVLCVPQDVQGKDIDYDPGDYRPSTSVYAGQQAIRPALDRLNEAVDMVAGSKKPVVVVGRGAMNPRAMAAAERLADRIGALIATSLVAKGTLADSEWHAGISGQFASRETMGLFAEADCVIGLGAGLNLYTLGGGYMYSKARFIQVDVAAGVVMGGERGADCYLQGDAAATATEMDDLLDKRGFRSTGFRTPATAEVLKMAGRDPEEFKIEPGTMDPREAARLLDEKLPRSVGVVSSSNAHGCSFRIMNMKRPRALQVPVSAFGCIGQALSTGIGVAVGAGIPIACLDGDGSALQSIQELDTAARLGLKFLYVIMNDEGYGAEYHKMNSVKLDGELAMMRSPEFTEVARGFGCRGRKARSLEELAAGVEEFLAGEGPMVIDARISRNVISIPYRRIHYGKDV